MKYSQKQYIGFLIILFAVIIYFLFFIIFSQPANNKQFQIANVTRIIDGDTFEISTGEKIRLICINTPEKNEIGFQEAKDFLSNLILNKTVVLEKDITNRDKYGRLLRYVYVNETHRLNISDKKNLIVINEIFVNKELVQQGYAQIYRYEPDLTRCDEIES